MELHGRLETLAQGQLIQQMPEFRMNWKAGHGGRETEHRAQNGAVLCKAVGTRFPEVLDPVKHFGGLCQNGQNIGENVTLVHGLTLFFLTGLCALKLILP